MGIPADNLGPGGCDPNNWDALPIHGVAQKLDRLRCGNDDIDLFERLRPIERDSGNMIYPFDSEGNYLDLHFARPSRSSALPSEIKSF